MLLCKTHSCPSVLGTLCLAPRISSTSFYHYRPFLDSAFAHLCYLAQWLSDHFHLVKLLFFQNISCISSSVKSSLIFPHKCIYPFLGAPIVPAHNNSRPKHIKDYLRYFSTCLPMLTATDTRFLWEQNK